MINVWVSEILLLCTYLSYISFFSDATIIMVNKDFHIVKQFQVYTNGHSLEWLVAICPACHIQL